MSVLKLFGYGRHPEEHPEHEPAGPPPEPLDAGTETEARGVLTHHGYGDGRTTGRMPGRGGDFMWPENGDGLAMGISDNGGNVSQLAGQPPVAVSHGWGDLSWARRPKIGTGQ
jgi:hypothetical protein